MSIVTINVSDAQPLNSIVYESVLKTWYHMGAISKIILIKWSPNYFHSRIDMKKLGPNSSFKHFLIYSS